MADDNNDIVDLIINAKNLSSDELKQTSQEVEDLGKVAEKTELQLEKLRIDQASINSFNQLQVEVKELKNNLALAEVEYEKSAKALKSNSSATDADRAAVKRQNIELKDQRAELRARTRELEQSKAVLKQIGVGVKQAATAEQEYAAKIEKTKLALVEAQNSYRTEAATLREIYNEKKKAIDVAEQTAAAEAKAASVRKAASNDSVDSLNKQIAAAKAAQIEKQKQIALDKQAAAEQARITKSVQNYELGLIALNKRLKDGTITKAEFIKAEAGLRAQLSLTESQIKTSKAALTSQFVEEQKISVARQKAAKERTDQINREVQAERKRQAEQLASAKQEAALAAKQAQTAASLKTYEIELSKLHDEFRKGTITKAQYLKGEAALRAQLNLTEKQVRSTNLALATDNLGSKSKSTDLLTKATRRLAQAYTVLLAAQKATQAITSSVKEYGDLEQAQIKVQKTTDLAREQIVAMSDELQRLASEITPTATNELLKYAEVAGQLGVTGSDNILQMVAAADALNVSTDLAGEEAATLLTRILTMTKEGIPAISNLASSVVELGNTTAATESEIVQMTKEIVTGTVALGLGSSTAAAYGATLKELGQTGERSRSAFTRLSNTIEQAVKNGGAELESLQNITGQTAAELEANLGTAPEKILNDFVAGLARVNKEGGSTSQTLNQFGITAIESISVFSALANNQELLAYHIESSNNAWEAGNAHLKEAAKAYASQDATMSRLINKFTELQTKIGEAYSDETNDLISTFSSLIDENADSVIRMMEYLGDISLEIANFGGALLETVGTLINFGEGLSSVSIIFNGFRTGLNLISGTLRFAAAGLLEMRIQLAEFMNFWSTSGRQFEENIRNMRESQAELFKGAEKDYKNAEVAIQDFHGTSSDAYRDLLRSANEYAGGVRMLSDEQRKQLVQIQNSGTYNAELQNTYRELTAAIISNNRQIEIETKLSVEGKARQKAATEEKIQQELELEDVLQRIGTGEETLVSIRKKADEDLKNSVITLEEYKAITTAVSAAQKELTSRVTGAALAQENANNTYSKSSDKVIKLKDDIASLTLAINEANQAMAASKEGNIEYEQAARDAATATRELKLAKEELAFVQELESGNLLKANALYRENELAISRLEAAYKAGRLSVSEYSAQMEVLKNRQSALKGVIAESTVATQDNTVATQDNTVAVAENADAKSKLAEEESKVTLAASAHIDAQLALTRQYDFTAKSIEDLTKQYSEMDKGVRRLSVFASQEWFGDLINLSNAAARHKRETVGQTIAMKQLQAQVESGSLTLAQLNDAANRANYGFDKLGGQQLSPLRKAIESAQREFERLDDSINNALDRTSDRLDRLLGKEGDILARRFESEIKDAQTLLDEATATGDAEAIRAARENIRKLEQVHQLELKNFKEEQAQAEKDKKEAEAAKKKAEDETRKQEQAAAEAEKLATEAKANLVDNTQTTDANNQPVATQPSELPYTPAVYTPAQTVAPSQVIQVNLTFGNTGTTRSVLVNGQESADTLISALTDLANNNLRGVN